MARNERQSVGNRIVVFSGVSPYASLQSHHDFMQFRPDINKGLDLRSSEGRAFDCMKWNYFAEIIRHEKYQPEDR